MSKKEINAKYHTKTKNARNKSRNLNYYDSLSLPYVHLHRKQHYEQRSYNSLERKKQHEQVYDSAKRKKQHFKIRT